MPIDDARCARCLELEDELHDIRRQLAAAGRYVVASTGPNTTPDVERELRRWLCVNPDADRLARWVRPKLHDWEGRAYTFIRHLQTRGNVRQLSTGGALKNATLQQKVTVVRLFYDDLLRRRLIAKRRNIPTPDGRTPTQITASARPSPFIPITDLAS